jgi:tyrosyl-tRNA synthetase
VTDVPDEELEEFRQALDNNAVNPMELKKRLGRELVTQLYDRKAASEAEANFEKVHQKRELPTEIPEHRISFRQFRAITAVSYASSGKQTREGIDVSRLVVGINLAKSRSEAMRLIEQGAVSIDDRPISSTTVFDFLIKNGSIIQVGKRRFAKVINTDIEKEEGK